MTQMITRRSCRNKYEFSSFDRAKQAADTMNNEERYLEGHYIHPYFCFNCGWWHVGNKRVGSTTLGKRADAVRFFQIFKQPMPVYKPPVAKMRS